MDRESPGASELKALVLEVTSGELYGPPLVAYKVGNLYKSVHELSGKRTCLQNNTAFVPLHITYQTLGDSCYRAGLLL